MSKTTNYRAGFVAIVGRPNAGKSTFLNRVVGQKVAIVTDKPQTTRNRIQGIVTTAKGQIIFIDTPGLHEADSALGRQMMHEVAAALEGISRNPGAAPRIQTPMILGLALIESLVLLAFVIAFFLQGKYTP